MKFGGYNKFVKFNIELIELEQYFSAPQFITLWTQLWNVISDN